MGVERAGVGDDKAEAVAMHGEASDDCILADLIGRGLRKGVAVGIYLHQLPAGNQLLQMLVEFPAHMAMQSQLAHELFESSRAFGLPGNVFQDGRVGEHGEAVRYQPSALSIPEAGLPTSASPCPLSPTVRGANRQRERVPAQIAIPGSRQSISLPES